MNPAQGQASQAQGQSGAAGQQQPVRPALPMYQPAHIRTLPCLSEEEKSKYETGLRGLWARFSTSPQNSADQIAAKQKIAEFSRMLRGKIQTRRQQAEGQQGEAGPARPPSSQQQTSTVAATQGQQKPQQATASAPQGQTISSASAVAQSTNTLMAATTATAPTAAPRGTTYPETIISQVNNMTFRRPPTMANKSPEEVAKWAEEMKEKYGRALMSMENAKNKVAAMDKLLADRKASGQPLQQEDLKQFSSKRDQQIKMINGAQEWMASIRKQQEDTQGGQQQGGSEIAGSGDANATSSSTQQNTNAPSNVNASQSKLQPTTQHAGSTNVTANAAIDTARRLTQQQQLSTAAAAPANSRPSPATGAVSLTAAQNQPRPVPQPAQQAQGPPKIKAEQVHRPVSAAHAAVAGQSNAAARAQTTQPANPVTASNQARALTHSAAMDLANQKAAGTPGSAAIQGQQPTAVNSASSAGAVNQSAAAPGAGPQQGQQGHPHAHPTQTQPGFPAKMPIPKQLPEKATAVPQGVALGGGVSAGRPTMSQGSGTLGGVVNQPPVMRVPTYSHDAEGDHVLSKKKLDELVRQVCGGGGGGDNQDGNLLTPEVEESVLKMADAFVDNVLNTAARNAKERGSKILEIRDLQLVLERTYNIRVPGYSSDELRTVRKIQPSPGWIAKMSAVQAAKVMPGKGDS